MSSTSALELAITLATRARDTLRQKHAQSLQQLRMAQHQLEQLEEYAAQTNARWVGTHTGPMGVELVQHRYQFMGRLDHAAQTQQGVLKNLNAQANAVHQALLQAEARLSGLQQVRTKRLQQQAQQQQRREQRATDEFAALKHTQMQTATALENPRAGEPL